MRVPWTARRSNHPILKEINPEYSLEGLMLKLQYFGQLMRRADSLEKTLMQVKIEGKRRKGQQRMRWLDSITDSMVMNLGTLWERTRRPSALSPWGQRVGHDLTTEQTNKTMYNSKLLAITPSIEDTLDKQWFSHMIKHSAAIKKNHAAKICADIECSLLLCPPPSLLLHVLSHFSHVRLFATLWTVARQAPLFMGFSKEEYLSGLPSPSPGIFLSL